MLKIWGQKVKGLQSYWLSNFENDSTSPRIEPGPNAIAHNLGGMAGAAHFFLRTPTLTASNFAALWPTDPKFLALKDLNLFLKFVKFQDASRQKDRKLIPTTKICPEVTDPVQYLT